MHTRTARLAAHAAAFVVLGAGTALAAPQVSDADKAFVAKVSQGGMYEVELGRAAEKKGATQDIRDQGNTETHDHTLVGEKLKAAATSAGLEVPSTLNTEFKDRLAKIAANSGKSFDRAYIEDMKKIHDADGAAFLKESESGTNPALKAFAAETYNIVQRHIGELDAKVRDAE